MRVMAQLCALSAGCATSSYQNAKMLPPGASQVGVAVNSYAYHEGGDGSSEEAIEVMGSTGVSDKVELGGKFAWFSVEDADFFNFLIAPKISITPDKLAFVAQSGFILATGDGESESIWMTMPGIVFTNELTTGIYADLTAKLIGFFNDDFDDYNLAGGGNLGLRVALPGAAWSLGPELGFMYDDDAVDEDTGYFLQFGVGFHYQFGGVQPAPAPSSNAAPPPPVAPPPPPPAEPAPAPEPPPTEPAPAPPP
jgi:hypothetical protein